MKKNKDSTIFLLGDSSLDNKYWIDKFNNPINGYETIIDKSKEDVYFWINNEIKKKRILMHFV